MEEKQTIEQELKVDGMTCASCVRTVREYLEGQGFEEVYIDLPSKKVTFRSEGEVVSMDELDAGIRRLGYSVIQPDQKPGLLTLDRKLIIATILTAPLLLNHIGHVLGFAIPYLHDPWIQFVLVLPVFFIGVMHFGKSAWASLRAGQTNMDVLIFLGSSAAFIYSMIGLYLKDPAYNFFETSAMIITLVLLGNWMENRALRGTTSALDELQKLRVDKARLWMGKDQYMDIPAADIRKGDRVMVAHGEAVPIDGTVMEGMGEVDESMLTGEAIPIRKQTGDALLSGATVVSGNFVVQATVEASETVFNHIIRLVKAAQSERPPMQRLADRISAWFVPLVILISIFAFFFGLYVLDASVGKSLMNAIAVLVISCPCAMGLATPTAITVGMGRMTRQGLLIKGAGTIEELAKIRQIMFDKTGTLTTGDLKVRQIRTKTGMEAIVRQYLYQMELRSTHPVARALIHYLGKTVVGEPYKLSEIKEIPGVGMSAKDAQGRMYALGRDNYDDEEGYHLALLCDGEKIGHVVLEDELREDAPEAIRKLQEEGYDCVLISGDHTDNVRRVAEKTGITRFYGRQLPKDKYEHIEEAMKTGPLAMVGDGINDAPALEKATVGIAMAGATHSALQSARVALLRPRLEDLISLFTWSKLTVKTIRENLFWAFSYNVVAIPLAVAGLLNPMWGALFMAFSDLVVIGNSLRLKYRKG